MKLKNFKRLNENWNNWVNERSEQEERDNLIDMIRDYSKELTGRRDSYGDYDKLATLSTQELKDYYEGMFDSPEAQSAEDDARRADQERSDAELGKDDEFDKMPTRSGMGRRMEEALPPHLAKFFDDEGNLTPDAAERIRKYREENPNSKSKKSKIKDVTPKGYGPKNEGEQKFQVGDWVRIVSGGLKGATGKVIELTTLITGEPGLVVLLDSDADKRVFGQAGDEMIVAMDKVQPPIGQMREEEESRPRFPISVGNKVIVIQDGGKGTVTDEYYHKGIGGWRYEVTRDGQSEPDHEYYNSMELDLDPSDPRYLRETVRKMVVSKLQEKAKSKNQQQFMGMVKKCQDTGDCASAEVKKAADSMKKSDVKDFASTKHKGLPDKVEEGRDISYSDVRKEYDAILDFLKKDILQKQGSKYVADALELLANDVRDSLHNPDPYDKDNYAYFDRDSGTQPNLKEDDLDERCQKGYKTHPTQKTKEMYGKTYRNCVKADEGVEVKDKFDDEVENRNKKSMKQGLAYLKKEANLGSFVDSILDEIMSEEGGDRRQQIISAMKDKLEDIGFQGEMTEEDFEAAKIEMEEDGLATPEELSQIRYEEVVGALEEAAKCTGPTKKASSDAKGKKWMKCVKSDSGGYKRIHWGQKGVRVTGKSGDTKRKKSFKARHNCSSAKSNTPQGQACKDWAE